MTRALHLLLAGLLGLALGNASAERIVMGNFQFNWEVGDNPGNTRDGGLGALFALDADFPLGQNFGFHVNVAPAGDGTVPVDDWITPLAGSGVTFEPIDLLAYGGGTFYTAANGKGEVFCNGNCPGDSMWSGLTFIGVWFEIETLDATSAVPEPASALLCLTGLAALQQTRRRTRR